MAILFKYLASQYLFQHQRLIASNHVTGRRRSQLVVPSELVPRSFFVLPERLVSADQTVSVEAEIAVSDTTINGAIKVDRQPLVFANALHVPCYEQSGSNSVGFTRTISAGQSSVAQPALSGRTYNCWTYRDQFGYDRITYSQKVSI